MSSNTNFLKLLKPGIDEFYNVETQQNENWQKIDDWAKNKTIRHFNTVAEMQAANYLVLGDRVKLWGYYFLGDGGHERIVSNVSEDTSILLQNNLYANLIVKDIVDIKWLGAKGDALYQSLEGEVYKNPELTEKPFDNLQIIQKAIDNFDILLIKGKFYSNGIIELKGKTKIIGIGSEHSHMYQDEVQSNSSVSKFDATDISIFSTKGIGLDFSANSGLIQGSFNNDISGCHIYGRDGSIRLNAYRQNPDVNYHFRIYDTTVAYQNTGGFINFTSIQNVVDKCYDSWAGNENKFYIANKNYPVFLNPSCKITNCNTSFNFHRNVIAWRNPDNYANYSYPNCIINYCNFEDFTDAALISDNNINLRLTLKDNQFLADSKNPARVIFDLGILQLLIWENNRVIGYRNSDGGITEDQTKAFSCRLFESNLQLKTGATNTENIMTLYDKDNSTVNSYNTKEEFGEFAIVHPAGDYWQQEVNKQILYSQPIQDYGIKILEISKIETNFTIEIGINGFGDYSSIYGKFFITGMIKNDGELAILPKFEFIGHRQENEQNKYMDITLREEGNKYFAQLFFIDKDTLTRVKCNNANVAIKATGVLNKLDTNPSLKFLI